MDHIISWPQRQDQRDTKAVMCLDYNHLVLTTSWNDPRTPMVVASAVDAAIRQVAAHKQVVQLCVATGTWSPEVCAAFAEALDTLLGENPEDRPVVHVEWHVRRRMFFFHQMLADHVTTSLHLTALFSKEDDTEVTVERMVLDSLRGGGHVLRSLHVSYEPPATPDNTLTDQFMRECSSFAVKEIARTMSVFEDVQKLSLRVEHLDAYITAKRPVLDVGHILQAVRSMKKDTFYPPDVLRLHSCNVLGMEGEEGEADRGRRKPNMRIVEVIEDIKHTAELGAVRQAMLHLPLEMDTLFLFVPAPEMHPGELLGVASLVGLKPRDDILTAGQRLQSWTLEGKVEPFGSTRKPEEGQHGVLTVLVGVHSPDTIAARQLLHRAEARQRDIEAFEKTTDQHKGDVKAHRAIAQRMLQVLEEAPEVVAAHERARQVDAYIDSVYSLQMPEETVALFE